METNCSVFSKSVKVCASPPCFSPCASPAGIWGLVWPARREIPEGHSSNSSSQGCGIPNHPIFLLIDTTSHSFIMHFGLAAECWMEVKKNRENWKIFPNREGGVTPIQSPYIFNCAVELKVSRNLIQFSSSLTKNKLKSFQL